MNLIPKGTSDGFQGRFEPVSVFGDHAASTVRLYKRMHIPSLWRTDRRRLLRRRRHHCCGWRPLSISSEVRGVSLIGGITTCTIISSPWGGILMLPAAVVLRLYGRRRNREKQVTAAAPAANENLFLSLSEGNIYSYLRYCRFYKTLKNGSNAPFHYFYFS